VKSLDPRVNRLPDIPVEQLSKLPMDQLGTFEVFVQPKDVKPFQHEGAVHASDRELAFILAKETFTRRFTCTSLWVAETSLVHVSVTTEGATNVYDLISSKGTGVGEKVSFEIFHLPKRGKQHVHYRSIEAASPEEAIWEVKNIAKPAGIFFNIWAIKSSSIRKTNEDEKDLWITLPDKKFRDAAAYKGGDKLKEFLEKQQGN
jgi:ring-1,2-phenylacetyl-CoA epoxidase subunit PaaB